MASMDYSLIADLYDSYVTTDLDVPFYVKQAHGCGQILELMSGTGRVSIPLLEAGASLTCVDSSPAMLDRLRKKVEARGLHVNIQEMDVCTLRLGKLFDLILLPFHSFAEIIDARMQQSALTRIREHLKPAGRFICPMHNPHVRARLIDGTMKVRGEFAARENGARLVLSSIEKCSSIPGIVRGTQYYDIFDQDGHQLQHREVSMCFYLHTAESFGKMVEKTGYRIKAIFGDYENGTFKAEESPFMIWVLKL